MEQTSPPFLDLLAGLRSTGFFGRDTVFIQISAQSRISAHLKSEISAHPRVSAHPTPQKIE